MYKSCGGSVNDYRDYLSHHGIPGMRWGVRRYQNKDGSLTQNGKRRRNKYRDTSKKLIKAASKRLNDNKTKIAVGAGLAVLGIAVAKYGHYQLSPVNVQSIAITGYGLHGRPMYGPVQTTLHRYEYNALKKIGKI